jgi:hypothetical protein
VVDALDDTGAGDVGDVGDDLWSAARGVVDEDT